MTSGGRSPHLAVKAGALRIEVADFKPFQKNTLQAFCDLVLQDLGLRINGATFHRKGDSAWVSMPARSHSEGKETKWSPIVEFTSKQARETFQAVAVAAVEAHIAEMRQ